MSVLENEMKRKTKRKLRKGKDRRYGMGTRNNNFTPMLLGTKLKEIQGVWKKDE